MVIRCLFGHDWILGRIAEPQIREYMKPKPDTSTNRQCFRCGKRERRADELEAKYQQRQQVKESLQ